MQHTEPNTKRTNTYNAKPRPRQEGAFARRGNEGNERAAGQHSRDGRKDYDTQKHGGSRNRASYGAPKPRGDRTDRPAKPWNNKRSERSDRPTKSWEGNRSDRNDRGDRYARPWEGNRSDRGDRNDRRDRPTKPWEEKRDDRGYKGERRDRPAKPWEGNRGDRNDKGDRYDRSDRGYKGERRDRPAKPWENKHDDRNDRGNRYDRSDRPAKPWEGSRDNRGDKGDRPTKPWENKRDDRGYKGDRRDRPAKPWEGNRSDRNDRGNRYDRSDRGYKGEKRDRPYNTDKPADKKPTHNKPPYKKPIGSPMDNTQDRPRASGQRTAPAKHRIRRQLPARVIAVQVLEEVLVRSRSLDDALQSGRAVVAENDKALLLSLVMGTLRWHGVLEVLVAAKTTRPIKDKRLALVIEMGLWQLAEGMPEYAAISETVKTCDALRLTSAKDMVNAILREYQRAHIADIQRLLPAPSVALFPAWLQGYFADTTDTVDEDEAHDQAAAPDLPDPVLAAKQAHRETLHQAVTGYHVARACLTLRIAPKTEDNAAQLTASEYTQHLARANIQAEIGAYDDSVIIHTPISVERLPGLKKGWVVVQDIAAQAAAHILSPKPGMRVLDACSAPGSKGAHMQVQTNNQLKMISLESDAFRSRRLRENFGLWQCASHVVIGDARYYADWWDGHRFDAILLDAPCSGTGVMRRNPDIPWLRQPEDIEAYGRASLQMLAGLWQTLKPGGRLLYCTCSVLSEENDWVMYSFLSRVQNAKLIPFEMPLPHVAMAYGTQIVPSAANDGLYYALIEKGAQHT